VLALDAIFRGQKAPIPLLASWTGKTPADRALYLFFTFPKISPLLATDATFQGQKDPNPLFHQSDVEDIQGNILLHTLPTMPPSSPPKSR